VVLAHSAEHHKETYRRGQNKVFLGHSWKHQKERLTEYSRTKSFWQKHKKEWKELASNWRGKFMRRQKWLGTCEIWGCHGSGGIDYSLTGCDAVYCGRRLPTAYTTRRDLRWKWVFLTVAASSSTKLNVFKWYFTECVKNDDWIRKSLNEHWG